MSEIKNLSEIQGRLKDMFKAHIPPLKVDKDDENVFEVTGTKATIQGKKKVQGYYFGSVVPKPLDIRVYYFPIYTHAKKFHWISNELRKCLKGKSCFHFKKLNPGLENEIEKMIKVGRELYEFEKLI